MQDVSPEIEDFQDDVAGLFPSNPYRHAGLAQDTMMSASPSDVACSPQLFRLSPLESKSTMGLAQPHRSLKHFLSLSRMVSQADSQVNTSPADTRHDRVGPSLRPGDHPLDLTTRKRRRARASSEPLPERPPEFDIDDE